MSWAYAICENSDVLFEKHDLLLLHLVMLPDIG